MPDNADTAAAERLAGHVRSQHNTGCDDIQNDYDALVRRHMGVHNSGRFMTGQPHEHPQHNDGFEMTNNREEMT